MLDHLGLRTRLFAAPGWAVSPGVMKVLPRNGFRLVAEMSEVTDLVRGTAVRARVLGIGEGFISEPWWCRTLVLAAERVPDRVSRVVAPHLLRPGGRTRRRTGHRLKTAPSEGDAQLLPAAHC